jgi:hypothetical protein
MPRHGSSGFLRTMEKHITLATRPTPAPPREAMTLMTPAASHLLLCSHAAYLPRSFFSRTTREHISLVRFDASQHKPAEARQSTPARQHSTFRVEVVIGVSPVGRVYLCVIRLKTISIPPAALRVRPLLRRSPSFLRGPSSRARLPVERPERWVDGRQLRAAGWWIRVC